MAKKADKVSEKIVRGLNEFAVALQENKSIPAQFTCRRVVVNWHFVPYSPDEVRSIRMLLGASQAVFARFLGVKVAAVQKWEQGRQAPSEMACRFMCEIQRDPAYWRERFKELIQVKETC